MSAKLETLDPNSFSNYQQIRSDHIHLNLVVNFDRQELAGYVEHSLIAIEESVSKVVFDTNQLVIENVQLLHGENWTEIQHELGTQHPIFGRPLSLKIPPQNEGSELKLRIFYHTTPTSEGIQWLSPLQTLGKQHPYLFTHCQPIDARSMLPCQDSTSAKFTYSASISCPSSLTAVMSALSEGFEDKGEITTYHFKQPLLISSYLIALAVGNLVSRPIGPRSSVWSEPEIIESVAYEFAETEKYIVAGERLFGPYLWVRFDILLMPPSFPLGGMENPCLTFASPSLLAGDRSLDFVIAHEIAHSWTGNLVTLITWQEYWLNEGFTMYAERKIVKAVQGREAAELDSITGYQSLQEGVDRCVACNQSKFTKLLTDLTDVNPSDSFNVVPYEKGFNLLRALELLVGDSFEKFIRSWVEKHQFKSVSTGDFVQFFKLHYPEAQFDWDTWLNAEGMPPPVPPFDTALVEPALELARRARREPLALTPKEVEEGSLRQRLLVLDELITGGSLRSEEFSYLGKLFGFVESRNTEVRSRWLRLGLMTRNFGDDYEATIQFLKETGRVMFILPVYLELAKANLSLARSVLSEFSPTYHPSTVRLLTESLNEIH